MTKKKSILSITDDLSGLFSDNPSPSVTVKSDRMTIERALATITRQMEISGNRPRTISDYSIHVKHFAEVTGLAYLTDITADWIHEWFRAWMSATKRS
jgi:hypothetical protein